MISVFREHFGEVLLSVLLLFSMLITIFVLSHEGWQSAGEGFKWGSNLTSGILGALLALLIKQAPSSANANTQPPASPTWAQSSPQNPGAK